LPISWTVGAIAAARCASSSPQIAVAGDQHAQ
jgi:hypothetical protein